MTSFKTIATASQPKTLIFQKAFPLKPFCGSLLDSDVILSMTNEQLRQLCASQMQRLDLSFVNL